MTGLALVLIGALSALNMIGVSSRGGDSPTTQLTPTPSPAEIRILSPGEVVSDRMSPGRSRVYKLRLEQGQFAQIQVDQRGVDLKLIATGPESFWIKVDSPNGFFGPETVSLLATVGGNYHIELSLSSAGQYPAGDYVLEVDGPREPTASDKTSFEAQRVFAEAQTLRGVTTSRVAAIDKYKEATKLWRQVDDFRQQGYSFTNMGRVYAALREPAAALENLDHARTLLEKAGDLPGQAFALNELGSAQRDFGDLRQAIAHYEEALKIRTEIGDRYGQAQLYNNLGLTFSYMGHQPQSLENYEKALVIWRELGVQHLEMQAIINAAKAHAEIGDLETARFQYETVLKYCNEIHKVNSPLADNARNLKAFALNGLGLVHDTWADTDTALNYYHDALELFHQIPDRQKEQGDVLDNIGMTYAFVGDPAQAIEYFQQALALRERHPRPRGMTLSNLGYAYALLKKYEEAQKQLLLALPLTADTRDRRFEAYTLVRLAMTYIARPAPEPLTALKYYEQALAIHQEPGFEDRRGQAITLDKIAEALDLAGREAEAVKKYEEATVRWKAVDDGQGHALSLYGIARIERNRLNLANARDRVEEAISIVEKLRNNVTARQLQMTYFAGKQDLYALAIDVRMQLYEAKKSPADLEAALAFSEKARARNLLDLLNEARAELYKGMSPEEAERSRRLEREISELTQHLVRFRGVNARLAVADVQQLLTDRINKQNLLLAPFKRAANRGRQAQPLSAKEIQQLLDDDMMLLQYSLGEERSHLWAVTRTKIKHYPLSARKEIENTASQLHQVLIAREGQRLDESDLDALKRRRSAAERYRQSAEDLSRLILGGVAPELGGKRLVIVPDGALHYIPFEALPLPDSVVPTQHASAALQRPFLLLSNEIIYQPSASALATLRRTRRPVASKKVAVIADPVFSKDEQARRSDLGRALRDVGDVASGAGTLRRLEYSLKEANAIVKVAPPGSFQAVGFKANRALATGPVLKRFGFVHFATHGLLNEKNPELSGIVLSMVNEKGQPEDGYLTLRDIYNLDLPAQLVVVSACETGIGLPVRGEGLIGLTRGFMNAGAQSVVVSLWRVEDEATAELMKRFYTHMFGKKKLAPAAALRQAKIDMKDDYYPYQWAGFVLQGDWK